MSEAELTRVARGGANGEHWAAGCKDDDDIFDVFGKTLGALNSQIINEPASALQKVQRK